MGNGTKQVTRPRNIDRIKWYDLNMIPLSRIYHYKNQKRYSSLLKITVVGITGLCAVTSAFYYYAESTRQVYIHRLRFPDNNAHKWKKYILLLNFYNVTIIAPVEGRLPHGRQEFSSLPDP